MSIFESLQGLSLDTKALIALVVLLWVISEVRHVRRHRADQRLIERLRADAAYTDGARLEAHRLPDVAYGAALTMGAVVPRGAMAGQHFVGTISNVGALPAEEIQVTASLGTHKAVVVSAPRRLPAHSAPAPVDVRLPFGFRGASDVTAALRVGEPLCMQIAYQDTSLAPHVFERCFTFAPVPGRSDPTGNGWVSRRVPCSGESPRYLPS